MIWIIYHVYSFYRFFSLIEYRVSWYFINYRNLILMRSCSYFIHLFEEYSFYNYCRIYTNMMCLSTLFDCLSLFYFYRVLLCFIFIILLQRFNTCVWFSNGNKLIVLVSKIAKLKSTAHGQFLGSMNFHLHE